MAFKESQRYDKLSLYETPETSIKSWSIVILSFQTICLTIVVVNLYQAIKMGKWEVRGSPPISLSLKCSSNGI